MDFKNKFIRYHPDITFEIFQLIWDKLESLGLRNISLTTPRQEEYHFFKGDFNFIEKPDKDASTFYICGSTHDENYTEITVEEFLGYNPFSNSKEIDWSKASTQELLDEAKRRYPIGTKFVSLDDNSEIREVKEFDSKTPISFYKSQSTRRRSSLDIRSTMFQFENCCSNPSVFSNGKWADIIQETINLDYPTENTDPIEKSKKVTELFYL